MNLSDGLSTTGEPHVFRNATSNIVGIEYVTYLIYAFFYILNIIIGLPISSYVLWLILKGNGNRISSELFSFSLTFCEVIFCLGTAFFVLIHEFPEIIMLEEFVGAFVLCGRPLFLCLICVERYVAVVHPITFLKCRPLRYRLACTAAAFVIVFVFGVFCALGVKSDYIYLFLFVILTMLSLLLSIELFCCFATIRALKFPGPGQKGRDREQANHMKRKAITVCLTFTVAVFFQFLPLFLAGSLYGTLSKSSFEILWSLCCIFSLLVGYIHPLHYIHRIGLFPPSCLK